MAGSFFVAEKMMRLPIGGQALQRRASPPDTVASSVFDTAILLFFSGV